MKNTEIGQQPLKMMRKTSAGILLLSDDKYLLGHPTEIFGKPNGWSIPKGEINPGENLIDCAVRECAAETSLDIYAFPGLQWNKTPTGFFEVGHKKVVFYYEVRDPNFYLKDFGFHCEELIDATDKPEIDTFGWFTREEARKIICKSQLSIFDNNPVRFSGEEDFRKICKERNYNI